MIGSRFLDKEGFRSGAVRRLGIGFLSALVRALCGVAVRDVTSGLRAADRAAKGIVDEIPESQVGTRRYARGRAYMSDRFEAEEESVPAAEESGEESKE